ncbi:MAG: hypothetical protein HYX67_09510 [Candidatus Melainabacteria bacterium]|nr:hypothetical protein [Candidatus Melainabacteria bacterium]
MPLQNAQRLAEAAGFNLYFAETEEEPPVAIFTTKNQSRELGQNSLKHKSETRAATPTSKQAASYKQSLDSKHNIGSKHGQDPKHSDAKPTQDSKRNQDSNQNPQSDKKPTSDRPKFTLVPEDPD